MIRLQMSAIKNKILLWQGDICFAFIDPEAYDGEIEIMNLNDTVGMMQLSSRLLFL